MIRELVIGLSLATASSMAMSATSVLANNSGLTTIGTFAAGTYNITATGVISLAGTAGDGKFDMLPTGIPSTPVTFPGYNYFNSTGSALDGSNSGNVGAGALFGALYGTFNASPSQFSDYFLIGSSVTQTIGSGGATLYARVNDTLFSNNSGAYSVSVTPVPEPHEWAMMLAGLGLVGFAARRRRDASSAMPAAMA
jgi:MYXO-CTERM domain-containing protein